MKEDRTHIDRYIVGFLTNDITTEELQTLNSWKKASQENQEEFDKFVSVWSKSKNLSLFSQIDPEKDWNCLNDKIKARKNSHHTIKSFSISARKIAAIFIPLFFISILGLTYWNVPGFGRLSAYQTNTSIQKIDLPDGSSVTLNKNSKIIYSNNIASADERNITLNGEAFFEVNHNNTPFNVEVSEVNVQVLGTKFNILEQDSNISVSVISGKVSVSASSNQVNLTKGERALVQNGKLSEENALTENDIYWCSKQLKFKQATLTDICKELQKNFSEIKTVKFKAKDLKTKVTTTFNNQSLKEIIEELKVHFAKKITFDGSTLTVSD